jgi:hypothetical protein
VDTPHQGSFLLTNLQVDSVNYFLNDLYNNSCGLDGGVCLTLQSLLPAVLAGTATLGAASYAPATIDLEATSELYNPYLTNLNSTPESFPRYGLIGESDQSWISFRTLADFVSGTDPSAGATAARFAGDVDDGLYWAGVGFDGTGWIYYDLWANDPNDPADPNDPYGYLYDAQFYWGLEDDTNEVQSYLEGFDYFWQVTAACNYDRSYCDPTSDGVVQQSSQEYPNAPNSG